MKKIAVTAASGSLDSEIVKSAVEIVGKENVVGLARTPSKAAPLGVEIRPGDYQLRDEIDRVPQWDRYTRRKQALDELKASWNRNTINIEI